MVVDATGQRPSTDSVINSEAVLAPGTVDADKTPTPTVASNNVLLPAAQKAPLPLVEPSATAVTVIYVPYPGDCCPKTCRWKYWCWESFLRTVVGDKWWTYRCYCKRLVDHRYFESFIIFMIVSSSVSLVKKLVIAPPGYQVAQF